MKEQPKSREYRKKPITIEAVQFNNLNREEIELFIGQPLKQEIESETAYVAGIAPPISCLIIPRLEGEMKALPGDYIIKGVKGEFYPCKPDIFALTYARVSGEPPKPDLNLEKLKRVILSFCGRVAPGHAPNPHLDFEYEWNRWIETGQIIPWYTHRDDAKEIIKVDELVEKLSGEAKTPDRMGENIIQRQQARIKELEAELTGGSVPTPSDELLDNCWRSACEFSLAAIRGGDFDSKKAFKEWLRSSTEQGVGNSGNKG